MQDHAYLKVRGEIIKVLRRKTKWGCSVRLRTSGTLGQFLKDESKSLENENNVSKIDKLVSLKNGNCIAF